MLHGHPLVELRRTLFVHFRTTESLANGKALFLLGSIESGGNHLRGSALLNIVALGHRDVLEGDHVERVGKNVVVDGVLHHLVLALNGAELLVGTHAHGIDTKTVPVVDFSGKPVLTRVVGKGLEVVAELLINLNLVGVLDHVAPLEAASEEVTAALDDAEAN